MVVQVIAKLMTWENIIESFVQELSLGLEELGLNNNLSKKQNICGLVGK